MSNSGGLWLKGDGSSQLDWSEGKLTDEDLDQKATEVLPKLLECIKIQNQTNECSLNISGNRLRSSGALANTLQRFRLKRVRITSLKLYKNQLCDEAMDALEEHILRTAEYGQPLMELHLSDNRISEAGIRTLVQAAYRTGLYLGKHGKRNLAFWLRVENQSPAIRDPQGVLDRLEVDGFPVSLLLSKESRPPLEKGRESLTSKIAVHMHQSFALRSHRPNEHALLNDDKKGHAREDSIACQEDGMGGILPEFVAGIRSDGNTSEWPAGWKALPNGSVQVDWSNSKLTDEDLECRMNGAFPKISEHMKSGHQDCELTFILAENQLHCPKVLANTLQRFRVGHVRIYSLKLHKNQLGDEAMDALAEHIVSAAEDGQPLVELHLSNNQITEAGIRSLVQAAYRTGVYIGKRGKLPHGCKDRRHSAFWLRVENQSPAIHDPQGVLNRLEAEGFLVNPLPSKDWHPPSEEADTILKPETAVHVHRSFLDWDFSTLQSRRRKGIALCRSDATHNSQTANPAMPLAERASTRSKKHDVTDVKLAGSSAVDSIKITNPEIRVECTGCSADPAKVGSCATDDVELTNRALRLAKRLQTELDERSMRMIQSLHPDDANLVLDEAEKCAFAQGGIIRNLSAVVQKAGRKMHKKREKSLISESKSSTEIERDCMTNNCNAVADAVSVAAVTKKPIELKGETLTCYKCPATDRLWYWHEATDSSFFEDALHGDGWEKYIDGSQHWWWKEATGDWFLVKHSQ